MYTMNCETLATLFTIVCDISLGKPLHQDLSTVRVLGYNALLKAGCKLQADASCVMFVSRLFMNIRHSTLHIKR